MMETKKAIEILDAEWKKSVGNYRFQNAQKIDRENALGAAISALREMVKREKYGHPVLGRFDFEQICEAVHNGWWDEKKRQGVTDHPDMIPYADLPENVKDYDRVTVGRVLDALGIAYAHKPGGEVAG